MAITNSDNKLIESFTRNAPANSGFLGEMSEQITRNRGAQEAARQQIANTGITAQAPTQFGLGAQGGRAAMSQGVGAVPPVPSMSQSAALPAASRVPAPTVSGGMSGAGAMPQIGPGAGAVAPAPSAAPALPTGTAPAANQLGQGSRALGPGTSAGTSATRMAAQNADDLIGVAGRAAAEGADDVAAAASRQAGAAARTAGQSGLRATAMNMGVNVTKQGLMRGAGVAGAGLMASQFFDGLDMGGENGVIDRGGSGAILGAGLGGGAALALGLGSGPAGWAALGGAALIGGYQALWGDSETTPEKMNKSIGDTRETITSLGEMYGIEGSAMDDILLQYEASTSMYMQNNDSEGLKQFMAGMGTQLPALMLQAREQQKAEGQEQARYDSMMQAQAQFAPIFERTLDRAAQASQTAFETANNSANYLDQRSPNLAALYRQTAAQSQASAANLQAAYAQQMAQAPVTTGTTDQLERQLAQEELMNQQLATVGQY